MIENCHENYLSIGCEGLHPIDAALHVLVTVFLKTGRAQQESCQHNRSLGLWPVDVKDSSIAVDVVVISVDF